MRRISLIAASLLMIAAIAFWFAGYGSKNLLSQPEEKIRASILEKAPLGSSLDNVEALLKSQGWREKYNWQGAPSSTSEGFFPGVKGEHIIGANLGQFRGILSGGWVDAYWGFDLNGRLIDLRVRKGYDGL